MVREKGGKQALTLNDIFMLFLLIMTIMLIIAKKGHEKLIPIISILNMIYERITEITIISIILLTLIIYMIKREMAIKDKILLGFNIIKPVFIDLSEPRHIVIFGMTGSGKTETAKRIAFSSKKRKFIMDWSGEYNYGVTATPNELSLNLNSHEIVDALTSAFQLTIPQQSVLFESISKVNNLTDIIEKVKEVKVKSETQREIKNAILRRLVPLEKLKLFNGNLKLNEVDTIDLSKLTYEAKKLVVNLILRMFYNSPKPGILIIEEAQNIIPRQKADQTPNSAELIINELRKKGVCVILIAQTPSQISLAFRNADYIIIHRLQLTPKEAQILGIDYDEAKRIARLETGECLLIERGRKQWVKVLLSKKRENMEQSNEKHRAEISIIKEEKHEKNIINRKNGEENHENIIEEVIEDLIDIHKWRKQTNTKIEKIEEIISKVVQDLREIYETIENAKKVEIASNPILLTDFIKRTNEKITQLSTAIAVLRRNNAEIKERIEEITNNRNQNLKWIIDDISNLNKKIKTIEDALKNQIKITSEIENKIRILHDKLIDFENWVKEAINSIA